jgi:hypothetical protein
MPLLQHIHHPDSRRMTPSSSSTSLFIIALTLTVAFLVIQDFRIVPANSRYLSVNFNNVDNHVNTLTIHKYKHNPRRFSTNTTLNIDRGLNIINVWSAQQMAAWIYHGQLPVKPPKCDSWSEREPQEKFLITANDTIKLQPNDTLFVSYSKLHEFVQDFLPFINVDIVLITTPFRFLFPTLEWMNPKAHAIVHHPHILSWFATNIGYNYTGDYANHSKVHSFPLGLKPKMGSAAYRNPIPYYRQAFLQSYYYHDQNNHPNDATVVIRNNTLYVSPMRPTNPTRKQIILPNASSSKIVSYPEYLQQMMHAKYVVSPNGDHPDCHRHYEALGLGAVPITELHAEHYEHFIIINDDDDDDGNQSQAIIFNNRNWNMTQLEQELLLLSSSSSEIPPPPTIAVPHHRNMVMEEYYMEYIERTVERALRWWDVVAQQQAILDDFCLDRRACV